MKIRCKNTVCRFVAYICILSIIFALITNVPAFADTEQYSSNEAVIIFGKELKKFNVDGVSETSTTMSSVSAAPDGTEIWKFKGSGTRACFCIDLPASFGNSYDDGSVYDVEIKYFDSNTGYAIIWYDALKWGKQIAYELYATNTNMWKTAKFTIDNAAFKGGLENGSDIMLSFKEIGSKLASTPFPMDISSIKITRRQKVNPVIAESFVDTYGNVFAYYSKEKVVHNELRNTTKAQKKVNVEYSLVDTELGDKVFSKTEKITIPANTVIKTEVNIETEQCGLYNWYVKITDDDGTVNSIFKEDTIAIIKTDPDGIKNKASGICTHMVKYSSDISHAAVELIAAANFGAIRPGSNDTEWARLESTKGDFYFNHTEKIVRTLKHAKEKGLDVLHTISGSNGLYEGFASPYSAQAWMPISQEAKQGFGDYAGFVAKNLAPYVDYYEIWNEPNINSFNPNGGTPEDLAEITRQARKAIDKYDPTALTVGMSVTEIYREDGLMWRDGLLEAGIVDGDNGMNALSVHPYHHSDSPETARTFDVAKEYQKMALEYGEETGVENMPLFVTEYGYTSADFPEKDKILTYPLRQNMLFRAHGVGEHMYYYCFADKGIIDDDREDNFGLVSSRFPEHNIEGKTLVPRETYVAFAAMNYIFGGNCVPDGTWELNNQIFLNRFKSDKFDANVLAMWRDADEAASVSLDLGVDRVDCYDIYGNKETLYGKDGVFTFVVNSKPAYIVGNFKENRVVNYIPIVTYSDLNMEVAVNDKAILAADINPQDNYEAVLISHGENASSESVRFENGRAELFVHSVGEVGNESVVDIAIYDNEMLVAKNRITVKTMNAIECELSFEPADSDNYNSWDGKIAITNHSFNNDVDAYLEFTEPKEFREIGRIDLETVSRKSTKEVVFNIPNLTNKGFKNIEYKILDKNSQEELLKKEINYDFNIAVRPKGKIVIDGIASEGEWIKNIEMKAQAPENFVALNGFECISPEDKSANVSVMWDDENLYMYTEVRDDIFYKNESAQYAWRDDSIQFGIYVDIGEEEFTAIGQSSTNYHEYTIGIDKDGDKVTIYKHQTQDGKTVVGEVSFEAKAIRNGTLTTYEWAFPWEKIVGIEGWHPVSGQILKFSMLWNDNDGAGRKGWIEYASGIGTTKDTRLFTKLLLAE